MLPVFFPIYFFVFFLSFFFFLFYRDESRLDLFPFRGDLFSLSSYFFLFFLLETIFSLFSFSLSFFFFYQNVYLSSLVTSDPLFLFLLISLLSSLLPFFPSILLSKRGEGDKITIKKVLAVKRFFLSFLFIFFLPRLHLLSYL